MGMVSVVRGVNVTGDNMTAETVATVAARKIAEIDGNTARVLADGFEFGGNRFSLVPDAVLNAIKLHPLADILPYPIPWSMANFAKTTINDAKEFRAFYAAMMTVEFAVKEAATTLRDTVAEVVAGDLPDAEKIQAILAIKDTRL